jgi:hypothetical protein
MGTGKPESGRSPDALASYYKREKDFLDLGEKVERN